MTIHPDKSVPYRGVFFSPDSPTVSIGIYVLMMHFDLG